MSAKLNKPAFFDAIRPMFGGSLSLSQVRGIEAILAACPPLFPLLWLAYALATTMHETARTMLPIEEYGRGKGRKYGPTGFWGRGFVQLTWDFNYRKATTELRKRGIITAAIDFVRTPDLVMKLEYAAPIMFIGMTEGWFTGKKLGDYFSATRNDPIGARRIINGTDKAAAIAKLHRDFAAALTKANYSVIPSQEPAPVIAVAQPQVASRPAIVAPAPAKPSVGIWPKLASWWTGRG